MVTLDTSRLNHPIFNMLLVFLLAVTIHSTSAVVRSGAEVHGEIVNKVVCQGDTLKIRCPNSSYGLNIFSGSYGRTQPGNIVCPYEGSEKDFYYNCGEEDVEIKLNNICQGKKKCIFQVGKAVFEDRCKGRAYLTVIYSCDKREKRKSKKKPTKIVPTASTTMVVSTTAFTSRHGWNMSATIPTQHGGNSSTNSTLIDVLFTQRQGKGPGIIMSIIIWLVYVTTNSRSFLNVFLITFGSAALFFLLIFLFMILHQRYKNKHRRKKKLVNSDAPMQKLNTITSSNCDVKKKSDYDTSSNTFPAPPPSLPPPPDDMMYPSPSPDMINSSRPPPPPVYRGRSLDDISKIGQDTKKHVPVTRSISLRTTRPTDYTPKDVNFDKLPNIDGAAEIQAVIIQRNNGSTMYMNPMYENGHMKEVTC